MSKLIIYNQVITKDKDIANQLNEHFTKIGKNFGDKVRPEGNHSFKDYLTDPISDSLLLRPTNTSEVLKETRMLRNAFQVHGHGEIAFI